MRMGHVVGNSDVMGEEEAGGKAIAYVCDECGGVFVGELEEQGGDAATEVGSQGVGGESKEAGGEGGSLAEGLVTVCGGGEEKGFHVGFHGGRSDVVDAADEGEERGDRRVEGRGWVGG